MLSIEHNKKPPLSAKYTLGAASLFLTKCVLSYTRRKISSTRSFSTGFCKKSHAPASMAFFRLLFVPVEERMTTRASGSRSRISVNASIQVFSGITMSMKTMSGRFSA